MRVCTLLGVMLWMIVVGMLLHDTVTLFAYFLP